MGNVDGSDTVEPREGAAERRDKDGTDDDKDGDGVGSADGEYCGCKDDAEVGFNEGVAVTGKDDGAVDGTAGACEGLQVGINVGAEGDE